MNKMLLVLFLIGFNHSVFAQTKTQEEFTSFFKKFNADKDFQIGRINFPITIKLNNDDYELVDYIVTKAAFKTLTIINCIDSSCNKKNNPKDSTVIIEERGINNGIFIDYIFEQRKGIWFLKTWIDSST